MIKNPVTRLALRALVAGVTTFCALLQGSSSWDGNLLKSAVVAAVLATLEVLTPLNSVVGPNK